MARCRSGARELEYRENPLPAASRAQGHSTERRLLLLLLLRLSLADGVCAAAGSPYQASSFVRSSSRKPQAGQCVNRQLINYFHSQGRRKTGR
jgi:hypothetical protein